MPHFTSLPGHINRAASECHFKHVKINSFFSHIASFMDIQLSANEVALVPLRYR
jgi:hypothetical protein